MPLLELDRLTLHAPLDGRSVALLRDISFTLDAGCIFGLVGESGAGKSMIGRLLSGLLPAAFTIAAGRLLFDNADLTPRNRRPLLGNRIAFIPQDPLSALNPVQTIHRQFADHLARHAKPLPPPPCGEGRGGGRRLETWLEAVHLPDPKTILSRYPHQLSGGQCQRVLIAMAFSTNPQLIIADEPTTALDVLTQSNILALLKEQQRQHQTAILLITHDLHLAAQICDEIGVMYAGDMVERGPAHAVLRNPQHPYTLALRNSMPDIDAPRRTLPTLPDQMPGLRAIAALPGCRFAPRCPTADADCAHALPPWRTAGPSHLVRCAPACQRTAHAPPANLVEASTKSSLAPVLELSNVSLTYRTRVGFRRRATAAVQDVSLRIEAGEFVGLVGESGSGKSSVARLIMGLERPTAGDIRLTDGQVQYVFQNPQSALNPRRRVSSLITQASEAPGHHLPSVERHTRALDLLRATGLPLDCLTRVPSQLSGGQKQRVNIARSLCVTPRLLIADEIVSGLDVSVQAQILNLLLQIGRDLGISLLLISHDLAVVHAVCTRVAVMHQGRIVESGLVEDVFLRPAHPYTSALLNALPSRRLAPDGQEFSAAVSKREALP